MGSTFWGMLLVVLGLQLLLGALLGIELPLLRIMFGVWVLYWGISLITGSNPFACISRWQCSYDLGQDMHAKQTSSSSSTVFGTQKIDFSTYDFSMQRVVQHHTVFGTTYIQIPHEIPLLINAQSTFGTITLPNHTIVSGGSERYQNYGGHGEPLLVLNVNVVFGTVVITYV